MKFEDIMQVVEQAWPEKPPIVCFEVTDVRPWVELKELILATDDEHAPRFVIAGSNVVFPLGPLGLHLLMISSPAEREKLLNTMFKQALEYRKKL